MSGRLATPVISGKTGSHIEGQMPGGWEQRQRTPLTARYSIYCVYWYKKYIEGQMPGGWEQRQRTPLSARYSIFCVYWYKEYKS